jgi:hypothetical protein
LLSILSSDAPRTDADRALLGNDGRCHSKPLGRTDIEFLLYGSDYFAAICPRASE